MESNIAYEISSGDARDALEFQAFVKIDEDDWISARVHMQSGYVKINRGNRAEESEIFYGDSSTSLTIMTLDNSSVLHIAYSDLMHHIYIKAPNVITANMWLKYCQEDSVLYDFADSNNIATATTSTTPQINNEPPSFRSRFVSYIKKLQNYSYCESLCKDDSVDNNDEDDVVDLLIEEPIVDPIQETEPVLVPSSISPPHMNIVILVVGTRGDVQPFIYFGQRLKQDGHRVRIATHADYRDDVIVKGGLEYYPLAGDPKKLSEYMVKTAGRLMPDLLNSRERRELPEKMAMLRDITFSCYPACTAPDPESRKKVPFLADAIISNPVSYGHIHCAEALSIPLHIMFPQPWYPTREFPHPLANMSFNSEWSSKNYMSYKMIDEVMWLGLGTMINSFRCKSLGLSPLRPGERATQLLNDNKIPISHMWSPSFVPRCKDWPEHVDVVGEYRIQLSSSSTSSQFSPPQELLDFLAAGDKPVYIGFGSMVIEDATKLVEMILQAAHEVGCRVLLQNGWTKYADENCRLSDEVMVIGAMPHDWLFSHVSATVHHGGAGTTSAGLTAGNPTFICPFFGDQHFWAQMVHRSGVGPKGCRISKLTAKILAESFAELRNGETVQRAQDLGSRMAAEDGVSMGVSSFYRNLPLANMVCEVSIFDSRTSRVAQIFCPQCKLKMSWHVDAIVHRYSGGRCDHIRVPYRPVRIGVVQPGNVMRGLGAGLGAVAYETAGGIYDLFSKPIEGAARAGITGAATGAAEGVRNLFARPLRGGKVLVDKVVSGAHGSARVGKTDLSSATDGFSVDYPAYELPPDASELTEEEGKIEIAYEKAANLFRTWLIYDTDGNRYIDEKELCNFFTNIRVREGTTHNLTPADFFNDIDSNGDRLLTFTELAWALAAEKDFKQFLQV